MLGHCSEKKSGILGILVPIHRLSCSSGLNLVKMSFRGKVLCVCVSSKENVERERVGVDIRG